jgi:hypothetical protein
MDNTSLSNFISLLKDHIPAYNALTDHFVQIEGTLEFVLTSDFSHVSPAAIQAQLMTIDNLVHEASRMYAALHTQFVNELLPQVDALQQT